MKKAFLMLLCLVSGCAVQMKPDTKTQNILEQHEMTLQAISYYIKSLQQSGNLPTPNEIESKK